MTRFHKIVVRWKSSKPVPKLVMLQSLRNVGYAFEHRSDYDSEGFCSKCSCLCGRALIILINSILDRAKIEAGKLDLEAVPFDLRSLMDDIISSFSSKSREKSIEVAVFVCDDVPKVVLRDPWRFRQILTNSVGNAVKPDASTSTLAWSM